MESKIRAINLLLNCKSVCSVFTASQREHKRLRGWKPKTHQVFFLCCFFCFIRAELTLFPEARWRNASEDSLNSSCCTMTPCMFQYLFQSPLLVRANLLSSPYVYTNRHCSPAAAVKSADCTISRCPHSSSPRGGWINMSLKHTHLWHVSEVRLHNRAAEVGREAMSRLLWGAQMTADISH